MKRAKSIEESGLLIKGDSEKRNKRTKRRISWNVIRHFSCQFISESINR